MPVAGQQVMTAGLRLCNEEVQQDCGASTELALCFDAAAMGLDQVLDDCQAEAGAPFMAGPARVDSIESLEDPRQVIGGDAGAGVADSHDRVVSNALRGDADAAAPRRAAQALV